MGEPPCLLHRPLVYGLWFPGCPDVRSRKDTSAIVLIMLCLQFLSRLIICWLPLAPDHKSVWENIPGMKTWNSSCENANPIAPPPVIIKAEGPLSELNFWFGEDKYNEKLLMDSFFLPDPTQIFQVN